MCCICMLFEYPCILPGLGLSITAHKTILSLPFWFSNNLENTRHNPDFPAHNWYFTSLFSAVDYDCVFPEAWAVFYFLYHEHMA